MDDSDRYLVPNFAEYVDTWEASDVADWIRGLDDCVLPFVHIFINKNICGRELFTLDEGDLERIGITNVGAQQTVLLALYQLSELCFSLDKKNLQTLAMKLGVQARNLHNELRYGLNGLNTHSNAAFGWLPNDILSHVSVLVEDTKEIVGWLDRCPFDTLSEYATVRNTILSFASTIVQCARERSPSLIQTARDMQMACTQLCSIADKIVEDFLDPLILQTAYLERTTVKRSSPIEDFGINIESTSNGIHIISEVKFQSPADLAGKMEAGDEIVQFCGQTVIGWPLNKLALLWNGTKSLNVQFLLKKRPHRYYGHHTLATKVIVSGISKMNTLLPSYVTSLAEVVQVPVQGRQRSVVKTRRRSSSMSLPRTPVEKIASTGIRSSPPASPGFQAVVVSINGREDDENTRREGPQRRATVSGGSPTLKRLSLHLNRNISVTPRPQTQWFNDVGCIERKSDINDLDMVLVRSRLSRPMPNWRASLIDNQLYIAADDHNLKRRQNSLTRLDVDTKVDDDVFDQYVLDELVAQAVEAAPSDTSDQPVDDVLSVGSNNESILVEASPNDVPPEANIDEEEWEMNPTTDSGRIVKDSQSSASTPGLATVHKTWSFPGRDSTVPRLAKDPLATLPRSSQEKLKKFFGEASVGSSTWYDSETDISTRGGGPITSSQSSVASSSWSNRFPRRGLLNVIAGTTVVHNTPKRCKGVLPSSGESGSPILTGMQRLTSTRDQVKVASNSSSTGHQRKVSEPARRVDSLDTSAGSSVNILDDGHLKSCCCTRCDCITNPDHAGLVYRARCGFESSAVKKWRKRWLVLKKELLFVYRSAQDSKAEGVLWLPAYRVCPAGPEYRTRKKNVFKLYSTYSCFYFYCCHRQDMFEWLQKLGLAAIGYTTPSHVTNEGDSNDQAEFYFAIMEDISVHVPGPSNESRERIDSPSSTGSKRNLVQTESFLSALRQSWRRSQLTRENSNESSLSCHSEGAASVSSGFLGKPLKVRDPLHVGRRTKGRSAENIQ